MTGDSYKLIVGPMFSTAEHAQEGEPGETNQILSSLHRRLQPHTPMMRSEKFHNQLFKMMPA